MTNTKEVEVIDQLVAELADFELAVVGGGTGELVLI